VNGVEIIKIKEKKIMINLLVATWSFLSGLVVSVGEMLAGAGVWLFDIAVIFHNDLPRFEGLLIGVLFAWILTHREKNPVLKMLAVPMKIVLDILDIIWHETLDSTVDVWKMFTSWLGGLYTSIKSGVKSVYTGITTKLLVLKDKLKKKVDSK
jgi:hypothetical protein